jgi:hypothetical protein
MPIRFNYDDDQEPDREHVLALHQLRRDLERRPFGSPSAGAVGPMTRRDVDLARELRELVEALDRRVPRVEQAGESAIASDAAALRAKAVARLSELVSPQGAAIDAARNKN